MIIKLTHFVFPVFNEEKQNKQNKLHRSRLKTGEVRDRYLLWDPCCCRRRRRRRRRRRWFSCLLFLFLFLLPLFLFFCFPLGAVGIKLILLLLLQRPHSPHAISFFIIKQVGLQRVAVPKEFPQLEDEEDEDRMKNSFSTNIITTGFWCYFSKGCKHVSLWNHIQIHWILICIWIWTTWKKPYPTKWKKEKPISWIHPLNWIQTSSHQVNWESDFLLTEEKLELEQTLTTRRPQKLRPCRCWKHASETHLYLCWF